MSKIQVNDIVNHFDDGAPNFPKGIVVGSGATLGFNVGTGASIYSPSDNVLTLGTNNAERLRITSAGDVGLGVTDATILDDSGFRELVIGGATEGAAIHLQDADGNVKFGAFTSDISNAAFIRTVTNHPIVFRTNNTEKLRIDSDNTIHIGKRDGNQNSVHFGTSRLSICGPDPIPTSVSKAGSYLAIGNNESELNGVYPITFGYTNNTNSHQPAYIAYKTTDAGSSEKGDLLFGTRNVTTDTEPTERFRITSDGKILTAGAASVPLTSAGGIDACSGLYSIVIGGNTGGGSNQNQRTDTGNKEGRIVSAHKTNAEEPVSVATIFNLTSQNLLYLGGGSSLVNAATDIAFYTAANTTTTGGTERMRIGSDGHVERNGVKDIYQSFLITGNQTYNWDFTVPDEGSYGNSFYLIAGFNHYYTTAYGAHRTVWFSARGTNVNSMGNGIEQFHSQSGSWTFSKPNSTTVRITKSAGTLNAPGYGFFHLKFNNNF